MSDYKNVNFGPSNTIKTDMADGSIHYKLAQKLDFYPKKITEKLLFWAEKKPEHTFLARKNKGIWIKLSYSQTLKKVRAISQYLLDLNFSKEDTIVILSENSLEHALLALAALHVGITYAPISPPYSLVSTDFGKLKHCLGLMTPKLVFAQNAEMYANALHISKDLFPETHIIIANTFDKVLETTATDAVEKAHSQVNADTVAKVLFTSGSTGMPKGVINTHKMCCVNLQQINQVFPFMAMEAPVFVDWLPWNHTFGGNHNFGLTLFNGGTLFMDEGKPNATGIHFTIENLREISPTAYFNVPKGLEMLLPFLENELELREMFFKKLNIVFFAGASLAQPIWNRLEELALETIGEKIPIITGLGCTESGPSAMFANWGGAFSGLLGVPVAGMAVKLIPDGDKLEVRYKAPNVTPGYWRNAAETAKAFDEEGYYKTGDAAKFLEDKNPDLGLVFDGRIAEDFKLSTGTWVNVGVLKAKIISTGSPVIQDVVLTGLDKSFVGAILFLNPEVCMKMAGIGIENTISEAFLHPEIDTFLKDWQINFNEKATGSSNSIGKYVIALEAPSIDLGEITDKGSLNQRAVLKHRAILVENLYKN
jgi:feruloyl-CoA synthase